MSAKFDEMLAQGARQQYDPTLRIEQLERENTMLRDCITVNADLFSARADRCKARANEKVYGYSERNYYQGRAVAYDIAAMTLRAALKL